MSTQAEASVQEIRPGDVDMADPDNQIRYEDPPNHYLAMLRRESPVYFNELSDAGRREGPPAPLTKGFWVLTKYADVDAASKDSQFFSSNLGGPILWDLEPEQLIMQQAGMMGMDRPEHSRYRKLVSGGFKPKGVAALEPRIRQRATEIVDAVAKQGRCDFVMDIAWDLPLTVLCEFMGIPIEDREKIFRWSTEATTPEGRNAEEFQTAVQSLTMYGLERAQAKREEPDDSLISTYANAEVDGESLSDAEIAIFFTTLSIAGHETTRNTSNHLMRLLGEHPEQMELLLSDIDKFLPNAIEEALRHSPPVMQFRRTLRNDVEMRGQKMAAGDKVYLSYVSANRDEEMFDDPSRFDITRENAGEHLAFGAGTHYCMGARLARMQLFVLFREVLTRLRDIRVVGKPERVRSVWFHAINKMEIAFTPE